VEADAHCNWKDTKGRRDMIKYLNSNIDHCLACVANDLETSSGSIRYQQRCLLVGLIILTGIRPGSGSSIGFVNILNKDINLSKSVDCQNVLNLRFFTKQNQLFITSLILHDPIFINTIEQIKKTKKQDELFFDTADYYYATRYLKSIISCAGLKELRTFKASYSAFCVLKAIKEIKECSGETVLNRLREYLNSDPCKNGRLFIRLLFKHIVEFMGHKSYSESLGYIDPDILFLILSEFLDREKSLLVLHSVIPKGIMNNWVDDEITLEKCQVCLDYYKIPKLIEIYNKIPNRLIEKIFN
jgi:hypothetical protein